MLNYNFLSILNYCDETFEELCCKIAGYYVFLQAILNINQHKRMLTKILSISGKPGLYKLISTGKNLNIVESVADGKRIPVYFSEKVVALSDVSIYTTEADVPLREVFQSIKEKEEGKKVSLGSKASSNEVFKYFEEILPDYDTDKVYASDVKKIFSWYNLLIENDISFEEEADENADDQSVESEKEATDE